MGCGVLEKEEEVFGRKMNKEMENDYLLPEGLAKRCDLSKFYKISEKIIGEGASGQVCIGEKDNQKYAIKRIRKDKIKMPNQIILEVKISLNIKHRNIMNYIEIYEDLKFINCVMELAEGGDLFDFILNHPLGHLPDDISISLMIQIFEVLEYLHKEKKIIHRDLKPENFLVYIDETNNPILKLIDFGLATYIPDDNKKINEIVGTRAYSAPEIIEKCGYSEKIDEWAAGVIMFNMLTGYEPFVGKTASQLKDSIRFSRINFDLIKNEELRELDKKLLNRFVQKRLSAQEALEEIINIKNEKIKEEENENEDNNENDCIKKTIAVESNNVLIL
jgi:serine/threonine protein kinase